MQNRRQESDEELFDMLHAARFRIGWTLDKIVDSEPSSLISKNDTTAATLSVVIESEQGGSCCCLEHVIDTFTSET